VSDCTPGRILDLNVLLYTGEDVPHLSDFILYQVLVRVGDLQPSDKHCGSQVVITVIHQDHQALKITNIVLKTLPRHHVDSEKVIIFLL